MINPTGGPQGPNWLEQMKATCTTLINQIKTIIRKTFTAEVIKNPLPTKNIYWKNSVEVQQALSKLQSRIAQGVTRISHAILQPPISGPIRTHAELQKASKLRARLENGKTLFKNLNQQNRSFNDLVKIVLDSPNQQDVLLYLHKDRPDALNQILGQIFHNQTFTDKHLILTALPQETLSSLLSSVSEDDLKTYLHELSTQKLVSPDNDSPINPSLPTGFVLALQQKFGTNLHDLISTSDMISLMKKSYEHDSEVAALFMNLPEEEQYAFIEQIKADKNISIHFSKIVLNNSLPQERADLEKQLLIELFPDIKLPQSNYHLLMSLEEEKNLLSLYGELAHFTTTRDQFHERLKKSSTLPIFNHLDQLQKTTSLNPLISNTFFDHQTAHSSPDTAFLPIHELLGKIYKAQGNRFTQEDDQAFARLSAAYKQIVKHFVQDLQVLQDRKQARQLISKALISCDMLLLDTLSAHMKQELQSEIMLARIQITEKLEHRRIDQTLFSSLSSKTPNTARISAMSIDELKQTMSYLQTHHPKAKEAYFACKDRLNLLLFIEGTLVKKPLIEACFTEGHFNEKLAIQLTYGVLGQVKEYMISQKASLQDLRGVETLMKEKGSI